MLELCFAAMEEAIKNFYAITKLKVTFCDKNRNVIFTYPNDDQEFCSIVCSCDQLQKECMICVNHAMDICEKSKEPYVYTCHMNLMGGVNPIKINGDIMGFVMFGHKIEEGREDDVIKRIFEVTKHFDIDGNELLLGMEKLEKTDVDTMEAAMNVMMMCTSCLYRRRIIIKRGDEVPSYRLDEYLFKNMSGDLSVQAVCRHFHISKSKLYDISKKAFGIGFSERVKEMRIAEGKKLLRNTSRSINQIAEDIGFLDGNYFIRVFRQTEGVTPTKYRKMMQKEPE